MDRGLAQDLAGAEELVLVVEVVDVLVDPGVGLELAAAVVLRVLLLEDVQRASVGNCHDLLEVSVDDLLLGFGLAQLLGDHGLDAAVSCAEHVYLVVFRLGVEVLHEHCAFYLPLAFELRRDQARVILDLHLEGVFLQQRAERGRGL